VVDVEHPFFHSSDKSQSDFSRLTSEKWALTSEKHELHKIRDTTQTQLGYQCASDV